MNRLGRLVAVHGHPLRASAEFAVGRRADGSATMTLRTALLECQQLLGTEGLVVDLGSRLNKILEVRAEQEVSEVNEFAVVLVLNVDYTPSVLASTDLLAIDNDALLGTNNSKRNKALHTQLAGDLTPKGEHATNLDLSVNRTLLLILIIIVIGVHLEVVESEFLLDALLEFLSLLEGQRVGLGDNRYDIDNIRKLLQDDNVDGLQRVTGWLDEEQAAVDTSILDIPLALRRQLLSQVRGVLILDVLDDRVPAALVVD